MGALNKQLRRGIILGIGVPVFLLGIVFLIYDAQDRKLNIAGLLAIATLCALPNLLLFFRAINKNNDTLAYGILLGCILWALIIFGIKLF